MRLVLQLPGEQLIEEKFHRHDVVVADLFSHGNTQKLTGKTEDLGWFEFHYLPDGEIVCRTPTGHSPTTEKIFHQRWPKFTDFLAWAYTHGADVNNTNNDGNTALIWATRRDRLEIVKLLLAEKANVNDRSNGGDTALILAARYDHLELVKLLKEHGAT